MVVVRRHDEVLHTLGNNQSCVCAREVYIYQPLATIVNGGNQPPKVRCGVNLLNRLTNALCSLRKLRSATS